jgi:hypothetical protein
MFFCISAMGMGDMVSCKGTVVFGKQAVSRERNEFLPSLWIYCYIR